ncbi:hypothetical protein PQF03_gp26 [Streptococcus phage P7953]|uniref:Uncharacterized protein n=1 Tax=Streptococcus phage P7953 TaxID=1971438 RepID=A0A286QS90_9CAUD|nr:hypothetical protein PQF03_gp26 [Streptococcus phage P7953]ARU14306.1 hypothetical protein P7953_26 [Streptococcus phage P7953]
MVLAPNKTFPYACVCASNRALNLISLLPFALDKLYLGYPITFYQIIIYKSNKKAPA